MPDIKAGSNEAVIFFKGDLVDKEVLYPEFEAVLDGYIGLPGYAGRVVKAVFLQITPRLNIQSAVFFTVPFTDDGQVEASWNIPLQHLADHGLNGPNLGEGVIRLACRSSCPVAWYKDKLWDPELQGNLSTFDLLKEAVSRNRLGLVAERSVPEAPRAVAPPVVVSEPASAPVRSGPAFNRKYRRRLEDLRGKHELELKTLGERLKRRVEMLESEHQERMQKRDEVQQEFKRRLSKSRRNELELQQAVDRHQQQFNKIRENYEDTLKKGSASYSAELEVLREQFSTELNERLAQQAEELQERISMREAELHYRGEQIGSLREEVAQLKKEQQSLLKNDSGQVLQRMTDSGITFVAYHPGIEHLVLTPAEITDYLSNPIAFVAERCGVIEEHYREWMMHYRLPVCRHTDEAGKVCGEPIDKVLKPKFFRHGEGDRCRAHQGQRDHLDLADSVQDASIH
ncbi:MAG: hypothetical protein CMN85_10315 [Spongiibacteraceae bacterium]|nr:hypothetical protein [Spongiibacteraceae bacterium]